MTGHRHLPGAEAGAAASDPRGLPAGAPAASGPPVARAFAHHSEAELARILDFYEVRWEYEPHVYPIMWSLDGDVQESFAPDFYLPDLDLYVELTTLRQRLVRKKNRKLRRLRELYPDIRIKLFYERDFRALMLKYGKVAIADELSGTVGQVGSLRAAAMPDPADPPSSSAPDAAVGRGGSDASPPIPPPAARPARTAPTAGTQSTTDSQSTAAGPAAAPPSDRRPRRGHEAPA